jgi:hypothetical protein
LIVPKSRLHNLIAAKLIMRVFQAAVAISDICQVFGQRQESRQWSDSAAKQLRFDQHSEAMKAVEMVVCPIISGQIEISGAVLCQVSIELG